jgi:propanediol dehydratase small subunit
VTEVRGLSGKPVADLTLEAVRAGEVSRAAELTRLPDDEVLAIYEALRPGRSTAAQLTALAGSLASRGLPRCAALVAEAADVYARRGLTA